MNKSLTQKSSINLTDVLSLIIGEVRDFSQTFSHIDTDRITVCIASNRKNSRGAIYGKVVPTRFEGGEKHTKFRGKIYAIPEVKREGILQKYLVYFYMPRFFDLSAEEKLRVILHELYHISPEFNGDIRRMGKGKFAHGHSRQSFDENFAADLEAFHEYIKETPYYKFLSLTSKELFASFDKVTGNRMKLPKPTVVGEA